jgi:ribokinase
MFAQRHVCQSLAVRESNVDRLLQSTPMGRVIVVGSVNVDFTVRAPGLPGPGETVTGGTFHRLGGGKGANQAVAGARAGATVTLMAAVGDDDLGRDALAEVAAEGVDVSRCLRIADASTGVALIVVDAQGENQIAVASGANERLDAAAVDGALNGVETRPEDVLLAGFEAPDAAVSAALRWASGRGMRTIVNPAPARPLGDELMALHPILTPNAREAATLAGEADPERAAIALHGRSGAAVVVTLGEDGVLVVDGPLDAPKVTPYRSLRVEVVDATGAGDALNGILAAELARGAELSEALRFAVTGAALSTRAVGARTGLPGRSEIAAALA